MTPPPLRKPATGRLQPVTANQVAARAGVSRSAVSRTFTEGASVAPETRRRVLEAAEALGYRPNLIARSLITGRSNIIGVMLVHFDNQFYPPLLQTLSIQLAERGYRMLLFVVSGETDFGPVLEEVLRHRVEALIMASVTLSEHRAELCRTAGIPVVAINHRPDSEEIWSVTGDNYNGARTVAAFLTAGGHRRFAMITGLGNTSASRDRQAGFCSYFAEQGQPQPLCVPGRYTLEDSRAAARNLLGASDPPDAIFCGNDHMALAVMGVAREEFGLALGTDLSIVGFDDAPIAAWPEYRLTTYSQPLAAMADSTVAALQKVLSDPGAPAVHEVVAGRLIVRASARLPASGLTQRDAETIWRP